MSKQDKDRLLEEQFLCRVAFKGNEYPYIAPFQYAFVDGSLYLHLTDYGTKMEMLETDNRVCVEIEKYEPDLSNYSFVVLKGKLEIVTDPEERGRAISRMAEIGKRRLSVNFLAAHGLNTSEGWSQLSPDKPLIIFKLKDASQTVGLKSP